MSNKKEKFRPDKYPKTMCYVLERDTMTKRCNKCGSPVLETEVTGYSYQCMNCDEDLFEVEVHEGKPHTTEEFNDLLLNTRDLLLLDDNKSENKEETKMVGMDRLNYLKRLSVNHIRSCGGVLGLREADEEYNNLNREIIKAYSEVYPNCCVGSYLKSKLTPYTGQKIYNFGCDFIVPYRDGTLELLMEGRLLAGHTDAKTLRKIQRRITAIGGEIFLWT